MATKTKTRVDVDAEPKTEAKADVELGKLYSQYKDSGKETISSFVLCIKCVKSKRLERDNIMETLLGQGLKESTGSSEASRIKKFADPKNAATLKALEKGETTIRAARIAAAKKQQNPSLTPQDKAYKHLLVAAKTMNLDGAGMGREGFLDLAGDAWKEVIENSKSARATEKLRMRVEVAY